VGIIRRSGYSGKTTRPKTVVADGCRIHGELTLDGDLHLDGQIDGNIHAINVSVGKTGLLKGEVIATHVTVSGRVDGKIRCELLELLDGCHVHGEVQCQNLVVEKGAKFVGSTRESVEQVMDSRVALPAVGSVQALESNSV
jgi:cytoskeletal protein CcmA (bactofilin family)